MGTALATRDGDIVVHPAITELQKQLAEIEEKVVTGFTLADAMREGASVTGQQTGAWVNGSNSCALGAAFLSVKARGYAA